MSAQFWSVGECMLELRAGSPEHLLHSAAGDTFNTAVYLKRLMPALPVRYVSALGDDQMSGIIRAHMRGHGIDDSLVATLPGELPGLYAIETDAAGERRFSYWRAQSAARSMLAGAHLSDLHAASADCRWMFLTGISLAILDDARREALLALARRVRANGGSVVVDNNYRARLWQAGPARDWLDRALGICTHALLSFEDEAVLHGDTDPHQSLQRVLRNEGVEVVIKLGAGGCLIGGNGAPVEAIAAKTVQALDTTAAGDSFNAAYLAARMCGQTQAQAASFGCELAAAVVCHPGAIIPQAAMPAWQGSAGRVG